MCAGDCTIEDPLPTKDSLRVVVKQRALSRQFMQRSLGCHVSCAALPMCDASWDGSQVAAVLKRLGTKTPCYDVSMMRRLRAFVRVWLRVNLTPLKTRLDYVEWLEHAPYSEARKCELRLAWQGAQGLCSSKDFVCKSFVKTETYGDYKYPRAINSRSDVFKVATGPFFHAIEQELFKLPWFVKYVPVAERARYLTGRLRGSPKYIATDYSAFEALFSPALMRAVELQLYSYMGSCCYGDVVALVHSALPGTNSCRFRDVSASVEGTRMSGDMCTSLGNGFTNLMVMLFVCSEHGITCDGVVEGDDGVFAVSRVPQESEFKALGLRIKLSAGGVLGDMGFCKQYFDEEDCANVVDPAELLCKFGWTHSHMRCGGDGVMRGLLRAKAFSLRSEMPNAPVAQALWRYGLRVTEGSRPRFDGLDRWKVIRDVVVHSVGIKSRHLVERTFGIPIPVQVEIEMYLDSLHVLKPFDSQAIQSVMKHAWRDYYWRYCRAAPDRQTLVALL